MAIVVVTVTVLPLLSGLRWATPAETLAGALLAVTVVSSLL